MVTDLEAPAGREPRPTAPRAARWTEPGAHRRIGWWAGGVGLVLLDLLALTGTPGPLRSVVGLAVAVVLPGALVLRLLGPPARTGWDWLVHAVALSVLTLTVGSFVLALLPGRTLTVTGSVLTLTVLVAALALAAHRTSRRARAEQPPTRPGMRTEAAPIGTRVAAAAIGLGVSGIGLVVWGATALNEGGSAALSVAGLVCAAAALGCAALAARDPEARTAATTALYFAGLSVLLATSLRGAGVTGHDIKIEYRVLLDTLARSGWETGGFNLSYNSCLSITVLPAFLARLLGVEALDVFRVCFQILFATVPVVVSLIARRLVPPGYAVLAGGLFIVFPTFVNDMPMLNRQEIAMIFFATAVLSLLDDRSWRRSVMFLLLGVGLTISHYTSTYTAAAVLAAAWLTVRLVPYARTRMRRVALGWPALVLLLLAADWAAVTGNAGEVRDSVREAAVAVISRAGPLSADSSGYSIVGGGGQGSDREVLDQYVATVRKQNAPFGGRPAPAACEVRLLPTDTLPVTPAGTALRTAGLDPGSANGLLRGAAVVLFQLGALLGVGVLWWRVRRDGPGTATLASLGTGALALLAVSVVAPQLSGSYGLLRLFQQSLVLLGPAVVAGVLALVGPLVRRTGRAAGPLAGATAGALVVGCLLSTSGVVPQLTGGYAPQLNLNNSGAYYHAYLAGASDVRTAEWTERNVALGNVVSVDSRDAGNLRSLTQKETREGMLPGAVPAGDYVQLTTDDGDTVTATAVAGDRVLRYSFPLRCVADGRPLLHTDGPHRVYGQVAP